MLPLPMVVELTLRPHRVPSLPEPSPPLAAVELAALAHARAAVLPRGGDPLLFDSTQASVLAAPTIDQSTTMALQAAAFEPVHLAERETGFKMNPMPEEEEAIAQYSEWAQPASPIKRSDRLQARMQQEHASKQAPSVLTHHPGVGPPLDPLPTDVYRVDGGQAGLQLALVVSHVSGG